MTLLSFFLSLENQGHSIRTHIRNKKYIFIMKPFRIGFSSHLQILGYAGKSRGILKMQMQYLPCH